MKNPPIDAREIEILLVEDNPGDVLLTKEALLYGKLSNQLHWVKDGAEAMAFLSKQPPFTNVKLPDIILLDLNLPGKNGLEVLSFIKTKEQLKRIPVIILTSSKAETDILRSYDLHANCYITKPVDFEKFRSVVQTIENFWLKVVTLPSQVETG
jgi:chemotaxis family two-component system response regulator Rcp1